MLAELDTLTDDFGLVDESLDTVTADTLFLDAVRAKNRSAWLLGDLFRLDLISANALNASTISLKTVQNYSSVCSVYPKHIRLVPVSFSHYESCAKLARVRPDEAMRLLREAYDGGLDRNWTRDEAAKLLGEYVEHADLLLVYDAAHGVFVPSGVPAWLPDGFTIEKTVRKAA